MRQRACLSATSVLTRLVRLSNASLLKNGAEDTEITIKRKYVPRHAGVVGGTDNGRRKTRNHGYDVVGGELFTDYSDHPRKLVTLNPKLKSTGAGRYQCSFPVGGMPTGEQLGLKDFLFSKSQDAVALQQIKERGAYL